MESTTSSTPLRLVESRAAATTTYAYVSAACRQVGGHPACVRLRWSRCTCPCHSETVSLVWRVGDRIVVTTSAGEVTVRSGSIKWARDLAEHLRLKAVARTPVGREEWVRESLSTAWSTQRHPSLGSRRNLPTPDTA